MKKKWLIVGIVAVAVIAVLAGYFISQGGNSGTNTQNQGKPVTAGTIQVPDGPKIKVVCVDFPEELKIEWEELGMDGFQVVLKGTLKNVSSQTVSFDRINFSLDGDWIGKWPPLGGLTLEPKGETKIRGGGIYSSESSKNQILEVKIVGFKKAGGSAPNTSSQPETPKPETPKPGMAPEEVAQKWYDLMKNEDFSAVMGLYTPEVQEEIKATGGVEALRQGWEKRKITKMEFERTESDKYGNVFVYFLVDYDDGVTEDRIGFVFKQVDGQWKLTGKVIDEF